MAKAPGLLRADIWILGKPSKDAQPARSKKKLVWMSLTSGFDVLRMTYLQKRASITSRSGWTQNRRENPIWLLRRRRTRSAGTPGTHCPNHFFCLWKIWSTGIATHPSEQQPCKGLCFARIRQHDYVIRPPPSSLYPRPHRGGNCLRAAVAALYLQPDGWFCL